MKRKAMRHLGDGWRDRKTILLRDPAAEDYPYVEPGSESQTRSWHVVEFIGHHLDCIRLKRRSFYAYLSVDGKHWDFASTYDDRGMASFKDPWFSDADADRLANLRERITDFWHNEIPESEQARFEVECLIKYDDIIEIDEKGDDVASFPHVFVALKDGRPPTASYVGTLRAHGMTKEVIDAGAPLPPPRIIGQPDLTDRVERFPAEFRIVV